MILWFYAFGYRIRDPRFEFLQICITRADRDMQVLTVAYRLHASRGGSPCRCWISASWQAQNWAVLQLWRRRPRSTRSRGFGRTKRVMYGFRYHFNNLRFRSSQTCGYCVFETCIHLFVSSVTMKCRFLKWLLDHPTKGVYGMLQRGT